VSVFLELISSFIFLFSSFELNNSVVFVFVVSAIMYLLSGWDQEIGLHFQDSCFYCYGYVQMQEDILPVVRAAHDESLYFSSFY